MRGSTQGLQGAEEKVTAMTTEIRCNVCGKTFKTTQALSGHLQGPCGDNQPKPANTLPETRMLAKPGSLDIAIENLQVPMVPEKFNGAANIYWAGFNKGVVYGADTILAGIRAAQELSSLGIAQATPVIKMAQEMRQAEGQAAQAIAAQLGQVTMQSNQQIIGAIHELAAAQSQGQPSEMNPMAKMFFGMMQPYAQQAIG